MTTLSNPPHTTTTASRPMPRLWARVPIATGTAIQLAGVTTGAALIAVAPSTVVPDAIRLAIALVGLLAIYLCSHAIAHVAVGRLVGIRFRAYGVRGTDHPETYPPGVRQLMQSLPMWSALSDKSSLRSASPWARAAMFAAGETSTTACSITAAAVIAATGVPGGHTLLTITAIWSLVSTIAVSIIPKGDYAKAMRALRTH